MLEAALRKRWRLERREMSPETISGTTKVIYLLLNSSFSQCIPIAQIINLDVFDEIAVLLIYFAHDGLACARAG
jgi:hypothetical protein